MKADLRIFIKDFRPRAGRPQRERHASLRLAKPIFPRVCTVEQAASAGVNES